jgi:hypothetical protein
MAAVATEDAWMETCFISISAIGASDVLFHGLVSLETLDFEIGEKDFESQPLVNGGRLKKWTPEGDTTVSFKAYPLAVSTDTGTTGKGFFDLLHPNADTTQPIAMVNSRSRTKYRVLFLWTNDPACVNAHQTTAANYPALRLGFADGYFVSVRPSFSDGVLVFDVKYKTSAYDKAGAANLSFMSTDGTSQLAAVAAYTTSNKFS